MKRHIEWFEKYAQEKITGAQRDPWPMQLKTRHCREVLAKAETVIASENFPEPLARACRLAALYHDVGRFDQYLQYGTFKDKISVNHALLSTKIIKREDRLAGEDLQAEILTAVALHNRPRLPASLQGEMLTVCNVTRDADKLDILRVMAEHLTNRKPANPTVVLGLPDTDGPGSQLMVEHALAGKSGAYEDLLTVNDFRLLLGTWYFELNFAASRQIYKKEGYGRALVEAITDNDFYREAKNVVLAAIT